MVGLFQLSLCLGHGFLVPFHIPAVAGGMLLGSEEVYRTELTSESHFVQNVGRGALLPVGRCRGCRGFSDRKEGFCLGDAALLSAGGLPTMGVCHVSGVFLQAATRYVH
jgi:hypothetical protein